MIIFGSRARTLDLGVVATENCVTCEKPRRFRLYLQYRYGHLYWIFRIVMEKKYLKLCEICRRGIELDKKQVEETLQKSPIPFGDRFGLLLVGGLFVAMLVLVVVTNR